MARLCFLREGEGSERALAGFDIDVDALLAKVGQRTVKYAGTEVPIIPTTRDDLTRFRQPSRTLAHISDGETNRIFRKEGWYLLEDVEPKEAKSWEPPT